MTERVSVIVTTCNREDALDAVLRALSRQTDKDFEVVVADDGSGPGTAALVEGWKQRLRVPLRHVWHAHKGFRAGEIRNRAVLACGGDYLVFLDGDCIARADFVGAHRALAERGWFVTGNRILLSQELTERVLREKLEPESWSMADWARQKASGGINRLAPMFGVPLGPLRKLRPRAWRGARSCNLAMWRADFDRVDGFDSTYNGWGREDSDLLVRLLNFGVRRKDGNFATGVLHLWHAAADRAFLTANDEKLARAIADRRIQALQGLSRLPAAAER